MFVCVEQVSEYETTLTKYKDGLRLAKEKILQLQKERVCECTFGGGVACDLEGVVRLLLITELHFIFRTHLLVS